MRLFIFYAVMVGALAAGFPARAQEGGIAGGAVTDASVKKDSFLDKWGDWYATVGKPPEEAARIIDERRAQRAQAAGSGLDQYTNAVVEKAGELKEQADAQIETAKEKIKTGSVEMQGKVKAKVEEKVKEKVDQKTEEIKKNAKAKLDAQGDRVKKAVDKKTGGFFSDWLR